MQLDTRKSCGLSTTYIVIYYSPQVRHEAAEALGAIGGEKAEKILNLFLGDDEKVITESCEVALDAMDYWANEFC